jgi:CDP-glucose 4,6-dehydratase
MAAYRQPFHARVASGEPAHALVSRRMVVDPPFWSGRRVLISGNTGFKGAWLTLWLRSLGAGVTGLARRRAPAGSLYDLLRLEPEVDQVLADLRDADAVAAAVAEHEPEVIFHLAGQPLLRRALEAPAETFEVNVGGTVHLLEAARASRSVRAIVLVGSSYAYADQDSGRPAREDDPLGAVNPYGSSKACQELVSASYREAYLTPAGVGLASARASNVIGGGDGGAGRLIPELIRAALTGELVDVRMPETRHPWMHVLAPVRGYLLLAQALHDDAAFATAWNFGPDDADVWPVRRIVERLEALWGRPLARMPLEPVPAVPRAAPRLDASRAADRLGWRPVWTLDEALAAVVSWYRGIERGDDLRALTLGQIEAFSADAAGTVAPASYSAGR